MRNENEGKALSDKSYVLSYKSYASFSRMKKEENLPHEWEKEDLPLGVKGDGFKILVFKQVLDLRV